MSNDTGWIYMYHMSRGKRVAEVYLKNGMEDTYKVKLVVGGVVHDWQLIDTIEECREYGEDFIMERHYENE